MRGWRAYYSGERVFTSDEHTWPELPERGVLGVCIYREPPYRQMLHGHDHYWIDGEDWGTSGGTHAERGEWLDVSDLVAEHGSERVKAGSWTSDAEYIRVLAAMMSAREL